jgi:Ca2+/H+ antiporter, TMEM165/GDT1 family
MLAPPGPAPGARRTVRRARPSAAAHLFAAVPEAGAHRYGMTDEEPSAVNVTVAAIVFGIVFAAELPDKTALASLMLGTRFRAAPVFAGVAAAFLLHVVLAIAAGSLLALLPHRIVQAVVAVLFLGGAAFLLLHHEDADGAGAGRALAADAGFLRVALTGFTVVAVAEFGDLTQIATANLAAKYHDPVSVGIGATLGLWAVAALAVTGGRTLLRLLPMPWITRLAAAAMAVMAAVSGYEAVHG